MKKLLSLILGLSLLSMTAVITAPSASAADVVKVACVGDSITQGSGSINYPAYLQELLGEGYEVKNFGLGGAAVKYKPERDGTYFLYDSEQYRSSLTYDADVVFVMMGTNDVSSSVLTLKKYFQEDYYTYLIKPYLDKGSEVVIMTSPHAYYYMMQDHNRINTVIRDHQIELAETYDLKLIDMNTATDNMRECFPDGLHGNASGYQIIAQTVYEEYFGGAVGTVTVKTQPGALVTAGRVGIQADEETGEAVLPLIPGEHDLAVTLDGYKSVYGTLTVPEGRSACEVKITEGGRNVAAGSTVTASSQLGEYTADKAADGSLETRWQAESWGAQWLTVDMGSSHHIGGVRILWEPSYASGYDISVSADGQNYTRVASVTDGDGATDEVFFDAVDARFVKLDLLVLGGQFAYSLYEVQVLESDGSPLATEGLTVIAEPVSEGPALWIYIVIAAAATLVIAAVLITVFAAKKKRKAE